MNQFLERIQRAGRIKDDSSPESTDIRLLKQPH